MKKLNVAVVGATGNVGQEMLKTLAERQFPIEHITALASHQSVGREVSFGEDQVLKIDCLEHFDFKGVDICLSSAGADVSASFAPRAAAAGCVVIDNTSCFRMDPDVPLVVPEVNPEAIADYKKRHIIANPNCSTIQMLVALKPLHDAAKIKRIVVSTYQAVSGAGHQAMDELFRQTRSIYVNDAIEKEVFRKQIAFNVIPQIDVFMDDGSTKEEWKMVVETKKILDPKIKVSATCVRVPVFIGHSESVNVEFEGERVPVFIGHSESVNVEFEGEISATEARMLLKKAKGVTVIDHRHEEGFVTPVECTGEDAVFVSRIREDISVENGLNLWIVSDNLRKGAALNAVQIAEILAKDYL